MSRKGNEMINPNRIEVGDSVSIAWPGENGFVMSNAEVLYLPNDLNQPWIVRESNGNIVYVAQWETISLKKKAV